MSLKETIVPGVHDYTPPQGLVTLQLTDPDRPWRVRKEVKAENTIMNWYMASVNTNNRSFNNGTADFWKTRFAPNAINSDTGFSHFNTSRLPAFAQSGYWPGNWGNYFNKFWASDADVSPDPDKAFIPSTNTTTGELRAYATTDNTTTLNAERVDHGSMLADQSWFRWEQARVVMEWGTTQGNGVWRTLGYGTINVRSSGNQNCPAPFYYDVGTNRSLRTNANEQPEDADQALNTFGHTESMCWNGTFAWSARSNSIYKLDVANWSARYGYTAFSTGSGRVTVAHDGTDLWVARGKTIYRCDDGDTANVINNTYDLSANVTQSDIRDITTDGTNLYLLTDTHVHVVTAATGVWASSWATGYTRDQSEWIANIEWDPNMEHLWVSVTAGDDGAWTSGSYTDVWSQWSGYGDSSWEADNYRVRSFSTAGVALPYLLKTGWSLSTDPYALRTGLTGMDPSGRWYVAGSRCYYNNYGSSGKIMAGGPSAVSLLNLGSDIEKTSSDSLKVIYDWNYS